jgi:hypothetical protein
MICVGLAPSQDGAQRRAQSTSKEERPLSGGFSLPLRRKEMPEKTREKTLTQSEKLRDRALRCRQLADGAGDANFAIKLYALSDEYEGRAARPVSWRIDPDQHK